MGRVARSRSRTLHRVGAGFIWSCARMYRLDRFATIQNTTFAPFVSWSTRSSPTATRPSKCDGGSTGLGGGREKIELRELIGNGENSEVESNRDDTHSDALAKDMATLLNLEGGRILLGVEDDGTITGLTRRRDDAGALGDGLGSKERPAPDHPCVEIHRDGCGRTTARSRI